MPRLRSVLLALAVLLTAGCAAAPPAGPPTQLVSYARPTSTGHEWDGLAIAVAEQRSWYAAAAASDGWYAEAARRAVATAARPAPSRPAADPATPAGPALAADGSVNGYPCGGDLPPCWVLRRESGGSPTAYNPAGCHRRGCGGLWQFDPATWDGFGGYAQAQDAPADVQNAKARQTWDGGRGCGNWGACS